MGGKKPPKHSLILMEISRFQRAELMYTLVTQRCAVSFGKLLQLVVVGQDEERPLDKVHPLHLGHHVLIDAIHDLLEVGRQQRGEDEIK